MRIVLGMFFCFLSLGMLAQPGDRYHRSASFMDFKDSKTKLYGFKNEKGKVVVPAIYSNAYFNPNLGTWWVQKDSLEGVYAADGNVILKPIYKFIEYLYVGDFMTISLDNKNFGLVDANGFKLLEMNYPRIMDFKNNLLFVCEDSKDSVFNKRIIDTAQNVILDGNVIHADIYGFVEDYSYDSTHVLYIQVIKNEKFAVFTSTGRQISDYIFKGLVHVRGNLIEGYLDYAHKTCGIIDLNNKIIIPFKYSNAGVFDNGTIRVDTEEGDSFYFDSDGKPITEREFKVKNAKHPYWGKD